MKRFDIALFVFAVLIVAGLTFATFKAYTGDKDLNTLVLTDMEVRHLQKVFECVEECRCNTGHLEFKIFNNIRIKVDLLEVEREE